MTIEYGLLRTAIENLSETSLSQAIKLVGTAITQLKANPVITDNEATLQDLIKFIRQHFAQEIRDAKLSLEGLIKGDIPEHASQGLKDICKLQGEFADILQSTKESHAACVKSLEQHLNSLKALLEDLTQINKLESEIFSLNGQINLLQEKLEVTTSASEANRVEATATNAHINNLKLKIILMNTTDPKLIEMREKLAIQEFTSLKLLAQYDNLVELSTQHCCELANLEDALKATKANLGFIQKSKFEKQSLLLSSLDEFESPDAELHRQLCILKTTAHDATIKMEELNPGVMGLVYGAILNTFPSFLTSRNDRLPQPLLPSTVVSGQSAEIDSPAVVLSPTASSPSHVRSPLTSLANIRAINNLLASRGSSCDSLPPLTPATPSAPAI